jgi:hypothetical protein
MHIHTAADPFIAPINTQVLDVTQGAAGVVTDHCEDGVPLIRWAHTRKSVTPIVGRVYAIARQTYQEAINIVPNIVERKGEYMLFLGFYGCIPDALLPYLSKSEDNSNLRVVCSSYAEVLAFTTRFSAYHFHVYVLTGKYGTDLGNHINGGWTHFGDETRRYRFPTYRPYVRYYSAF